MARGAHEATAWHQAETAPIGAQSGQEGRGMGLGAEFVPQLWVRVGKRVVQWGCTGAELNPAEPSGSSRGANLPQAALAPLGASQPQHK